MSLSSSRTFLGTALIAFAVLAVYGGTVGFGFVFDDHVQIERNPWLRHPDGFRLFLTRPFWGFYPDRGPAPSNYYRPVFGFADSLVARIWGLQPAAFHAASVLLHAAVSLLVALGARRFFRDGRLFRNDTAALAAGLLFAVYPAHAEAVAWVAGQADLLAALFVLAATFAYLQSPKSLLGPIAYFLACLSKETGAALIVVLAAVEISEWRREGSPGAALRRAAVRLAPYGLALAVYVVLPVLAANSIGGANFAERYLYLPSIGLAWLAGLAWSRIAGSHRAVTAAALAGLIVLGIAAWARSTIYGSDLTLFSEVVRVNPRNEIARNNLGMALYHEGRLDEAEREYRLALRLKPRNVAPLSNLAVLRERQGRSAEAEKLFEDVLRISPVHAVAAVHLARAQIARGDQTGAARRLDALFAAGGESYDALVERADLWLEEGRPEKAVPLLERAVEMFPGRVKGREMLGRARKVSPPNVETPCRRLRGGRTV